MSCKLLLFFIIDTCNNILNYNKQYGMIYMRENTIVMCLSSYNPSSILLYNTIKKRNK